MRARRLVSIDLLRGVVIALMALDHVRDFWFHGPKPTDLAATTPALFLTRFITHYCAPVFVFTAGLGAALSNKAAPALARFLVARGAFLILLEVTLIGWSWRFDIAPRPQVLQVFWALGASMIVLGGLVLLPRAVALVFGLALCLGHNALDGWHPGGVGWSLLHEQRRHLLGHADWFVWVAYPLVPWVGVMALGWATGAIYRQPDRRRVLMLAALGALLVVTFIAGRALGVYGDPSPYVAQSTAVLSTLSFFNVTKYPPSLLYLCVTLGPALLFLAASDGPDGESILARVILVFGRTPLFFYLLHIPLIHVAAVLADRKVPLWGVWLVWLATLIALYPACRAYDIFKRNHPEYGFLKYL